MAFGSYGASVITAFTAQNMKDVEGVYPGAPGKVRRLGAAGLYSRHLHRTSNITG